MIKPEYTSGDFNKFINERIKNLENAIINRFNYIGLDFVNEAKSRGGYQDRTGNLRGSVSYIVAKNGKSIYEDFSNDVTGSSRRLANKVLGNTSGIVLVVVAGMHYASAVESRGKDVLTGSSLNAVKELKKFIDKLKKR